MKTLTKYFFPALVIVLIVQCEVVQAKKPPREVFGLRMGMDEESVHKRLRKIATQQKEEKEKEEEGEQEVWMLNRNPRFNYVLTRFDRHHRLTLVTVVAQPNRVRYSDVASEDDATVATDGRNFSYKWRSKENLVIARGSSAEFLTSYSFYPVSVRR